MFSTLAEALNLKSSKQTFLNFLGSIGVLNAGFGQGVGIVNRNAFLCSGTEVRLIHCRRNPYRSCSSGDHRYDVGVRCQYRSSKKIHLIL